MNERYSVPGAIVLAGAIIAGAIVFTQASVPTTRTSGISPTPAATDAATPSPTFQITLRSVDASRDHIRGAADAPVTLVEYSDLECPFCRVFHATLQQALKDYDGKIRWVYRHFPITQLHSKAQKEAEASECAAEQGKFWEFIDRIFEITPSNDGLDPEQLTATAQHVGINIATFAECLKSGKHAARVQKDLQDAATAGAQGTPYTVILGPQGEKGEKIPLTGAQPYPTLKKVLDQLLQEV